jgi:hypothetical protein
LPRAYGVGRIRDQAHLGDRNIERTGCAERERFDDLRHVSAGFAQAGELDLGGAPLPGRCRRQQRRHVDRAATGFVVASAAQHQRHRALRRRVDAVLHLQHHVGIGLAFEIDRLGAVAADDRERGLAIAIPAQAACTFL